MAHRRHQFLTDMIDVSSAHLADHLPAEAAQRVAESLADRLTDHWGGQLINIPKDFRRRQPEREAQISQEFNGSNYGELAIKYDMCEHSVRKLLTRVKARAQKEQAAMPQLFS